MNKTILKIIATVVLLFIAIVVVDAFYSAVVVGNQLLHASILSAGLTVFAYLIALVIIAALIYNVWKKQK